jgi:CBS domain-containing protein
MKTVEQVLRGKSGELVSVGPDESVFDALTLMARREVGAVVVLEGARLVGILSERDYARKIILLGKASKDTAVRDIMTQRVVCVSPATTIDECMALMTDKRCRHLPVLEGDRVIGVVSIGDVVKHTIAEQQFIIEQLEHYIMG